MASGGFVRPSHYPELIGSRYINLRKVGNGSYGTVYEATDSADGAKVAIKRVRGTFDSMTDAKRTLREMCLMRMMHQENIIRLRNVLQPINRVYFTDVWMVLDHGGWDLGRIIRHIDHIKSWDHLHVKFIMYQTLCALNYMHSANIIHRDMKPSNILVDEKTDVKIIDFGLSRQIAESHPAAIGLSRQRSASKLSSGDSDELRRARAESMSGGSPSMRLPDSVAASRAVPVKRKLTQHVVTRWYRAPELVLLDDQYTFAIDMWSCGCILGELLQTLEVGGRTQPLFPGKQCFPLSGREASPVGSDLVRESQRRVGSADSAGDGTTGSYETLMSELGEGAHQLTLIMNILGTPNADDIECVRNGRFRKYLANLPAKMPMNLTELYPTAPAEALDLLRGLLTWNPDSRLTVSAALESEYFLGVRDPEKEVIFEGPPPRMFAFEGSRMPNRADEENRLRQLLLCEIDSYSAAEGTERAGAAGRSGSICSSDYSAPAGVGASTKDSAK